jgi:hypothetical protein
VNLSVLEQQRLRNRLAAWCRERNALANLSPHWCVDEQGGAFLVSVCGSGERVLRIVFDEGRWSLFMPASAGWLPYPARASVATVDELIDELEQAPLHIHW